MNTNVTVKNILALYQGFAKVKNRTLGSLARNRGFFTAAGLPPDLARGGPFGVVQEDGVIH